MVKATKSAQTTKFTSYMIFDKFESIVAKIFNKLPEIKIKTKKLKCSKCLKIVEFQFVSFTTFEKLNAY